MDPPELVIASPPKAGPDRSRGSRSEHRLLVIGPEDGLTEPESSDLVTAGAQLWGLGPLTLRAETAAVAASEILPAEGPRR